MGYLAQAHMASFGTCSAGNTAAAALVVVVGPRTSFAQTQEASGTAVAGAVVGAVAGAVVGTEVGIGAGTAVAAGGAGTASPPSHRSSPAVPG